MQPALDTHILTLESCSPCVLESRTGTTVCGHSEVSKGTACGGLSVSSSAVSQPPPSIQVLNAPLVSDNSLGSLPNFDTSVLILYNIHGVHAFALRSGPRTNKVPASLPRILSLDLCLVYLILRSCEVVIISNNEDQTPGTMSSITVAVFGSFSLTQVATNSEWALLCPRHDLDDW